LIYYIIPARLGSKGFPRKNRKLFPFTAETIRNYKNVIVTSDDNFIIKAAENKNFTALYRNSENVHKDKSSMKDVLLDVVEVMKMKTDDIIVCLYLTYPERTDSDIKNALRFFTDKRAKSMLCQKPVKTHPFMCMTKKKGNKGSQITPHNLYRRQDYPAVFEISHYIIIIQVSELMRVNSNLYNKETLFYSLNRQIVDVDSEDDFKKIKKPAKKIKIEGGSFKTPMPPLEEGVLIKDSESEKELNFKMIEVDVLKEMVSKKSVILIANSGVIKRSNYGNYIDSFDVVVRFNSFIINPEKTGTKTTIHAMVYLQDYNMDVPCETRIICCGKPYPYWRHFIKHKVQKDKQKYIVRRKWFFDKQVFKYEFEHNISIIPTTGFSMIKLFHWMNNYKRLHLLGFDFCQNNDPYRQTPGICSVHRYDYEAEWTFKKFKIKSKNELYTEK